jgi:hypothetical protein
MCAVCNFTTDHLLTSLSPQALLKMQKHTELVGGSISLHGNHFNASYDYYGILSLPQLIRYAVSYGHRSSIPSSRGSHRNNVIVAYVPEIIGSGRSIYNDDYLACSGVCIISPNNISHGHSFPVLDQWVEQIFCGIGGTCFRCGTSTPFGHPLCSICFGEDGSDWRKPLTFTDSRSPDELCDTPIFHESSLY